MAKPKFSKSTTDSSQILSPNLVNTDIEDRLNLHVNDSSIHVDSDFKESQTFLRKDLDSHLKEQDIHVTASEKVSWNSKETTEGAQSKMNKVMSSLNTHKSDYSMHITKAEKDSFKDKYTRAEVKNLIKHTLIGLKFLPAVMSRSELNAKYTKPEFNSCVFVKNEKINLVFNGQVWVEWNAVFGPGSTNELDGLMSAEDKVKLDSIEANANYYAHPDNVDTRHVSDAQIDFWNNKAEGKLVSVLEDGLMKSEDKVKLDSIEANANYYAHPEYHDPCIIKENEDHKFVSDKQISMWDSKAEVKYVDDTANKVLSASKSFTESKVASMVNSSEAQLQVLRSLAFELKNDKIVKQFLDLYNECVKNKEFESHAFNDKVHMSVSDRNLLVTIKEALETGIKTDWENIDGRPVSLPANGGNADTVGGFTAEQLMNDKCFYDRIINSVDSISNAIGLLNKTQGINVLIKNGDYVVEKELVIKTSNSTISGIGVISKLLGVSIKIVGNNNIIENITFANTKDSVVNKTAIYVEGNDNVIRYNTIMNYNEGILVEGSNNIIEHNTLVNIRNTAIKFTSNINANYNNTIRENNIKNSNTGILLLSSNLLSKNHISKNNVLNCSTGILLTNIANDMFKTVMNIVSENIVMRGRGEASDYLNSHRTIVSEFASKNIISSNITSGKEVSSSKQDVSVNNLY